MSVIRTRLREQGHLDERNISAKSSCVARAAQQELPFRRWGGKRTGAGRPPNGSTAGVSHLRRPSLSHRHPVHVTLRVGAGLPSLRDGRLFRKVRDALSQAQERLGFRLVHFSVQSNHLHLIAEVRDRRALSSGLQGLCVRVARAVNRVLDRRGRLFADRYHARALKTPRALHFALRYVLLNVRKHSPAASGRAYPSPSSVPAGFVDNRSSAAWFDGFSRPQQLAFGAEQIRAEWRAGSKLEAPVVRAKTWLLLYGSRRYGGFDVDDTPG
jgi:putative transposase